MTKLTIWQHLALAAFWLGQNFLWGALVGPMVLKQVSILHPVNPASILWIPGTIGGFPALIVPLIAGPLSDRCRSRFGRRRPFLMLGAPLGALCLFGMSAAFQANQMWSYFGWLFLLGIPTNAALAAYSGVIPDTVPAKERGLASGLMAVATQIGTLTGVFLAGVMLARDQHHQLFTLLASVYVLFALVSAAFMKDPPATEKVASQSLGRLLRGLWINPKAHPDFAWVWLTRALMKLGFYMVIAGLFFYFGDVLGALAPERDSAMLVAAALIAATISGILGGRLSDRIGRKKIVVWASYGIGVSALSFLFCRNMPSAMVVGVAFGFAYGAYVSVDWALASDVLPNPDAAAKDMAVWHVAEVLPQQFAAILGNGLLALMAGPMVVRAGQQVQSYKFGAYICLFGLSALMFFVGGRLIWRIKGSS